MKKIIILMGLLSFYITTNAQEYILARFSSKENIPVITYSETSKSYQVSFNDPAINKLFSGYVVTKFTKAFPHAHLVDHPLAPKLDRVYKIEVQTGVRKLYTSLLEIKSSLFEIPVEIQEYPKLLYQPNDYNNIYHTALRGSATTTLEFIHAPEAWDITHGNNVLIGIIDVPMVRTTHEDLQANINASYVAPWDPATVGTDPGDYWFHATMVGTSAAGVTDNGLGIASIGFNSKLNFYDYLDPYDNIIQAAMDGCKIINNSYTTGSTYSQNSQDVINMVHDVYNPFIVAGAGNGNNNTTTLYPASYKNVVSVSSVGYMPRTATTDPNFMYNWEDVHDLWPYIPSTWPGNTFNHTDSVDICAPGYYVYGANPVASDNAYKVSYGTSFSSPIVCGTAALMLAVNPNLVPEDIEDIIKSTAADVYEQPENLRYLNKLGSGRLNAGAAVKLAQTWPAGSGIYVYKPDKPTDIKWFEILSDGVNTTQTETSCGATSNPSMCNTGFRLEVVAPSLSQSFKWLIFYEESGTTITKSIKYGNSIVLTRGVDYPAVNNSNGLLRVCVRAQDILPGLYYYEEMAYNCLGTSCSYPCPSDITITGSYSTALTESATWVKTSGQTTISPTTSVKLDANPVSGYVLLKPASTSDYVVSSPSNSSGVFVIQGYNGCVAGSPAKQFVNNTPAHPEVNSHPEKTERLVIYPNPSNGVFNVFFSAKVTKIKVTDIWGNTVIEKNETNNSYDKIDLSSKSSGMYIMLITEAGVTTKTKIVKL